MVEQAESGAGVELDRLGHPFGKGYPDVLAIIRDERPKVEMAIPEVVYDATHQQAEPGNH